MLAEKAGLAERELPTARKPSPAIAFCHFDRNRKGPMWEALWEGLWEEFARSASR